MTTTVERLNEALKTLSETDAEIEAFELRVKELKAKKNQLESQTLVELFNELGIRECVFDLTGEKVKRDLVITGGLTKDPNLRPQAIEWLIANGHEDSLNAEVTASWARGDMEKARRAFEHLRGDNGAKVVLDEGIHASTLKKIVRDGLKDGTEIPLSTLGVDVMTRVAFSKR